MGLVDAACTCKVIQSALTGLATREPARGCAMHRGATVLLRRADGREREVVIDDFLEKCPMALDRHEVDLPAPAVSLGGDGMPRLEPIRDIRVRYERLGRWRGMPLFVEVTPEQLAKRMSVVLRSRDGVEIEGQCDPDGGVPDQLVLQPPWQAPGMRTSVAYQRAGEKDGRPLFVERP